MEYFELYEGVSRRTPAEQPVWNKSYDIIIAGAGNAGIYCAMSAALEGRKILLIEKAAWCGGMHIQGLVNGYYYGCRGGLYEETDRESHTIAKKAFYDVTDAKRMVVGRLLKEKGIDVAGSSIVTGVYAENKKAVGVRAYIENENIDLSCSMLVDATSDGHVLRMLPVPLTRGRLTDHEVQPFSSVRCVYLDENKYDGGLRVSAGNVSGRFGVYHEYRDNGYVNQYEEEEFSDAMIRAHASHLKTLAPEARFLYIAPQIGVREGVLYEGEQTITLSDLLEERKAPENPLLYCFSDIDKHGSDMAFDEKIYQDWFVNANMSTCTVYIPLAVGCVVPKGWKGFLTTGRCLSVDSYVNSAVRMNADTFRIGEACGTLAAMAVDYGQSPMSVPYDALQKKLEARDFFKDQGERRPAFWTPAGGNDRRYVSWMKEKEEIREALSTDKPSVALWSCRLQGRELLGDMVYGLSRTDNEMLHRNAGIALGLMQDERALPILHEIIKDRKPFYFMDCRRSNQMRSVIAICLCGQMADKDIYGELLDIIKPEEFEKPMYHELLEPRYELTIVKEQNSVYFQHFSHSVAALVKIAEAHPEVREEITNALHEALDDETYIGRITREPSFHAFYQAAYNCKRFFRNRLLGKK